MTFDKFAETLMAGALAVSAIFVGAMLAVLIVNVPLAFVIVIGGLALTYALGYIVIKAGWLG